MSKLSSKNAKKQPKRW